MGEICPLKLNVFLFFFVSSDKNHICFPSAKMSLYLALFLNKLGLKEILSLTFILQPNTF